MADPTQAPAPAAPAPAASAPAPTPAPANNPAPAPEAKAPVAPVDPLSEIPSALETQKPETPNDGKTPDAKAPAADPAKTVPDKYTFKEVDGYKSAPETLESYSKFAKENNLSQETAQKAYEFAANETKRLEVAYKAQQIEALKKADEAYRKDPKLGGANYEATKATVRRVYDNIAKELSPASKAYWDNVLVNQRGANTLPYAELFNAFGKFYAEDRNRLPDNNSAPSPQTVTGFNLESVRRAFKIK